MRNFLHSENNFNPQVGTLFCLISILTLLLNAGCKDNDSPVFVVTPPETTTACDSVSYPHSSTNFSFYYSSLDTNICEIADSLEQNYFRIINDLQTDTLPVVNVHFYDDHDSLAQAVSAIVPNLPSWAIGLATSQTQIHLMSPNYTGYSFQYMITNLIHEFAHCVSMHINSTIPDNPRWLWESVAIFEAGQFVDPHNIPYLVSHDPPTLATLNSYSNTMIYDVGYLIAEYIVDNWDYDQLNELIVNNGDIQSTLGLTTTEFQDAWFEYVQMKYGI